MSATRIQRVAIAGAGAMGGMYADHFLAGRFDVAFVATGSRADRLRRTGLTVNGVHHAFPVVDPATETSYGTVDLILFCTKSTQLAEAISLVAPLVGPQTLFLSVLNGLDSERMIAAHFDPEQVLLCVAAGMDARREQDRVFYSQAGRLLFGSASPGGTGADRIARVSQALDRAGLAWANPDQMLHTLWWKFMVNVGINQASAVMRAPYGAFRDDGPARALMLALMAEVIAVANAEGVSLGEPDLAEWDRVLGGQPADGWTSMRQDVEAGLATEVDTFAARVVELGRKHRIETPYNQAMLWVLHGLEQAR